MIALLLLLIAIALSIWKFYPQVFRSKAIKSIVAEKPPLSSPAEIDTFVTAILAELRLNDDAIKPRPLNNDFKKVDYACFKIGWPRDFPYIWFTERLQRKADSLGNLTYDAVESTDGNNLLVWIIAPEFSDTLAEIALAASSGVSPRMSSIAFLFDNFANFKSDNALDLIWLNIPFGFILQPDQIPNEKLIKALKASPSQGILSIPTDSAGWALILSAHKLAKTIRDTRLNEANMRAALGVIPVLNGFFLHDGPGSDREIIKLIIQEAEALHLTYLYSREQASYADSLAYLKGMKIKSLDNYIDCREQTPAELRKTIIDNMNDFTRNDKGTYLLASDAQTVEVIKSLQDLMAKLNIIIVPPLRTASTIEGL